MPGLDEYRRKRDFRRTGEPRGRRTRGKANRFVVHKHGARSLHYDLRLECDGVLKSWAVPKGPSTDPGDKRLARRTEDHPREYAEFEGTIPEGEYGAGTVIVWDAGTYRHLGEGTLAEALDAGHASVWLSGKKMRGGWSLTRMRRRGGESWLLVKQDDDHADRKHSLVDARPESVKTHRALDEIDGG